MALTLLPWTVCNAQIDSAYIKLDKPADGKAFPLESFYRKLYNAQTPQWQSERVNVLHMGGSHVQAGDISHAIRLHLEPKADRGLLFPFRAIKTNGPVNYRFDYTGTWKGSRCVSKEPDAELGLSGAAAITSDREASITLRMREPDTWDFDQLIVLGQPSDASVRPYLLQANDTLWPDAVVPTIADVEGSYCFTLAHPDSVITLQFAGLTRHVSVPKVPKGKKKAKAPEYKPLEDSHYFILRGMLPISGRQGVTYTESGVNGASLSSWLRTTSHFEQELSLLPPDLVIFGIGINDANIPVEDFDPEVFKDGYRQLISRIHSVSPEACLLFLTNNDCLLTLKRGRIRQPNPNTARVRAAMLELAAEYDNAVVFDVYGLMGGLRSSVRWVAEGLMKKDRIHFTRDGYFLVGDCVAKAIDNDFQQWKYSITPSPQRQ